MPAKDRLVVSSVALIFIVALSLLFANDSILLLFGLFAFLAIAPHVERLLRHFKKSFAIEILLAVAFMVSMFFLIRPVLHDATAQATLVAVALLALGLKLIIFPVYE